MAGFERRHRPSNRGNLRSQYRVLPRSIDLPRSSAADPDGPEGQTFEYREEKVSDSELKRKYEKLKKKVEEMESEILNKERDWDDRFFTGK